MTAALLLVAGSAFGSGSYLFKGDDGREYIFEDVRIVPGDSAGSADGSNIITAHSVQVFTLIFDLIVDTPAIKGEIEPTQVYVAAGPAGGQYGAANCIVNKRFLPGQYGPVRYEIEFETAATKETMFWAFSAKSEGVCSNTYHFTNENVIAVYQENVE